MEILSTGDKIRRARIYEGITLKELCEDKISISKMSCIENGKIKADEDTLRHIAGKLNLKYEYLVQDIRAQVEENVRVIENGELKKDDLVELIKYNFEYAIKCEYYDLAFKIIHKLFEIYRDNDDIDLMQRIISQYHEIYQKNEDRDNTLIYYSDMAAFFMTIKEYHESINYCIKILKIIDDNHDEDRIYYIRAYFIKGLCHMMIGDIQQAYDDVSKSIEYVEYIKDSKKRGRIYHTYSELSILLFKVDAEKYIEKAYSCFENDKIALAKIKAKNGRSFYTIGESEKGREKVIEAVKLSSKEKDDKYIEILIDCVEVFYLFKEYDLANEMIDEALNLSIYSDKADLIERAYYYKGMILQKQGFHRQAETYMNISTDYFLRTASKEDTYKRYNEMADLYYNIGELREAIKYFTLAMNIDKNQ